MAKEALALEVKKSLEMIAMETEKRLKFFWDEEIERSFGFDADQKALVRRMLEHAKEHNLRTGKRLRAALVYFGYLLGNNREDERIWAAMEAVELVHTALLMHDDFMDEDVLRRGKPTTQMVFAQGDSHYGESMAVNVGDVVLGLGYERLLKCGFEDRLVRKALGQLLRGVTKTAFGQAYDMSLPKMESLNSESVLALHRAKTAIYTYENPLMIGARLGEVNEKFDLLIEEYASLAGVAFQIQDDILGVFGEKESTGKSNDSDLLQGKVTLLITKLMEKGNDEQKKSLAKVWGKKSASTKDLEVAKRAIKKSGAYQYSVDLAQKLSEESVETVKKMRNLDGGNVALDYLEGLAWYLRERKV